MSIWRKIIAAAGAAPVLLFWLIVKVLPVAWASAVGAAIGALLGRVYTKKDRVKRNLRFVYPDLGEREFRRVVGETWRNAGSVLAELPHLQRILRERVEVDIAPAAQACIDRGERLLFVSAHVANWEVVPRFLADINGPILFVFTPLRNPYLTSWLQRFRGDIDALYVEKEGALAHMMRARRKDLAIGVMGDIRVDSGIMLDLFGKPAPTSIAAFRVAQRIGYGIAPVHAVRLEGARFRIIMDAPLTIDPDADQEAAVRAAEEMNTRIEEWLAHRPNQWWCFKRRWPADELDDAAVASDMDPIGGAQSSLDNPS